MLMYTYAQIRELYGESFLRRRTTCIETDFSLGCTLSTEHTIYLEAI